MNKVAKMTAEITLQDAATFIWHEADILDRGDYDAWLDLWTGDGLYVIPINPDSDDYPNDLNIAYDDAGMRKMRVGRLAGGFAISAAPAAKTVRLNARFVLLEQAEGHALVRSAMHLTEDKFGRQRTFAANVEHRLVRTESGLKIRDKIVRLVNSDGVLTSISYLF
ncbi:aromatic-ring-hydroxylating dioxygenase subunit beta [Roseobacter sp. MH60115]|uniref:aromatic-ring-hydroxylating dioxygenase subunit beta n=1 Tax=Roseobacter sp. MH60115 TaxID=2785324 RepID=UPI0018A314E9|nr:aromatic-ring-hydroxylating dioxygenase subunit beta [Roseobacter sp. MH60115]